jgi:CDP-diacylglycerol---serine O-phosphatidyltransferase
MAVLMIGTAAALDGLDGRLARMLQSESAIGAELDSLCDFVNFRRDTGAGAVSLGACVPETSLGGSRSWSMRCAACCGSRGSTSVAKRSAEAAEKTSFIGVPSPAGALLALGADVSWPLR